MTTPLVIVPYVEGGLCRETRQEVYRQWPVATFAAQRRGFDFDYADTLRTAWHEAETLIIIEQDVVPPPGSIRELLRCPDPWCTYPMWLDGHHQFDTLGLAKFSQSLCDRYHDLVDMALASPDPRRYVRDGLTRIDPNCTDATLQRYGRTATLRADATNPIGNSDPCTWPSTIPWNVCDSHLSRLLRKRGYTPHVHHPAPKHLHRY